MYDHMTAMSAMSFDRIRQNDLSAAEAAEILTNHIPLRTFKDKLAYFANGQALRPLLLNGLLANHPEQSPMSMDRKVRNWLKGDSHPTKRQDIIELCFVLGLSVTAADAFMAAVSDEGFRWRDPKEIVYIFALNQHRSYAQACELSRRIWSVPFREDGSAQPRSDSYTPLIRREILSLSSEDELREFLETSRQRLGERRNSAYRQFMELMGILECPEVTDLLEPAHAYTTRQIVDIYLDKQLPSMRKGAAFTAIQRDVRANWPDETAISRMKSREIDVTRKVLILLFLATDGGSPAEEDEALEAETPESRFRSSYCRMNQMLEDCGFRSLDPRNAFDWVALYCLRVEDDFLVDEHMRELLNTLFDSQTNQA